MHERKHLRDLAKVMIARRLQERAARFVLSDAVAEETRHEGAVAEAGDALEAALHQWSAHLAHGLMDHEHLRRLSAHTLAQEASFKQSQTLLVEASALKEAARQTHAVSHARVSQAAMLVRRLKGKVRRKDEERAQSALEDRLAGRTP